MLKTVNVPSALKPAKVESRHGDRLVVDHGVITHCKTFTDIALYNEDGELIGRQSINLHGDTPEISERGRAWRHSEVALFGKTVTMAELLALELAGEIQYFDSAGNFIE